MREREYWIETDKTFEVAIHLAKNRQLVKDELPFLREELLTKLVKEAEKDGS